MYFQGKLLKPYIWGRGKDLLLSKKKSGQPKLVSGPHWEKNPEIANFLGRILAKTKENQ